MIPRKYAFGYEPEEKDPYTYKSRHFLSDILENINRVSFAAQNIQQERYNPEKRTASEIFAPVNPLSKHFWKMPEQVRGRGEETLRAMRGWAEEKYPIEDKPQAPNDLSFWEKVKGAAKTPGAAMLYPQLRREGGGLELGEEMGPTRYAAGGALSEIVGDPVTYTGLDPLFKILKKTGTTQAILKGKSAIGAKIPAYFKAGALDPATKAAMETAGSWQSETLAEAGRRAREIGDAIKKLPKSRFGGWASAVDANLETQLRQITKVVEQGGDPPTEAHRQVVKLVESARDWWEKSEKILHVPALNAVDEQGKGLNYILHHGTRELKRVFGQINGAIKHGALPQGKLRGLMDDLFGPDGVRQIQEHIAHKAKLGEVPKLAPAHKSMVARHIGGSVDWINDIAKKNGFKDLFHYDPRKWVGERMKRMVEAGYKGKFLEGLADAAEELDLARLVDDIDPEEVHGWYEMGSDVLKHLKKGSALRTKLEGLRFRQDTMDDVYRVFKSYVAPEPGVLGRGIDKIMSVAKQTTLLPWISYHFRNDFTDAVWFNTYLKGVLPQFWDDAVGMMTKLQDAGQYPPWARKYVTNLSVHAPFSVAHRWVGAGLKKVGLQGFSGNLDDEVRALKDSKQLHKLIGKGYTAGETGGFGNVMGKIGGEFGRVREDWARIAQYLHHREKGDDIATAVRKTLELHYDYSRDALSPFELQAMSRMFYFYRWTRMNTPGSIRNLAQHFGKHSALAKVINAWESQVPEAYDEGKFMPEFLQRGSAIRAWPGKMGPQYLLTQALWPFAEVARWSKPGETIREALAPWLKIPAEIAANKEFFWEQPIKRYEGERRKFFGKYLPAEIVYALRQVRGATEVNRAMRRVGEAEGAQDKTMALLKSVLLGSRLYGYDPEREAKTEYYKRLMPTMGQIKGDMKAQELSRTPDWNEWLRLFTILQKYEQPAEEARWYGWID